MTAADTETGTRPPSASVCGGGGGGVNAATVLRWEAPPPDARGRMSPVRSPRRDYTAIAAALRERPGEWAVVAEIPYIGGANLVTRINRGAGPDWRPAGSFEATCRYVDGTTVVYARFLGAGMSR